MAGYNSGLTVWFPPAPRACSDAWWRSHPHSRLHPNSHLYPHSRLHPHSHLHPWPSAGRSCKNSFGSRHADVDTDTGAGACAAAAAGSSADADTDVELQAKMQAKFTRNQRADMRRPTTRPAVSHNHVNGQIHERIYSTFTSIPLSMPDVHAHVDTSVHAQCPRSRRCLSRCPPRYARRHHYSRVIATTLRLEGSLQALYPLAIFRLSAFHIRRPS
jgi:hypothetical protein